MTDDERAFLAAFAADPADRTARLAYADWLDDRGDPRAELVRVCEAMRRELVFADRYWELKARRNELRKAAPADWLAATGYDGSDYDPVFRDGVPDDWKGRWRLIRKFTERWHGVPMGDVGRQGSAVRAEERALGLIFPPSIREWVAYTRDVVEADVQVGRDPWGLTRLDDLSATALLTQAEGDLHWAVRDRDWNADDPPVTLFALDYDAGSPLRFTDFGAGPLTPTVSGFAFGYLATYFDILVTRTANPGPAEGYWRATFDSWEVWEGMDRLGLLHSSTHPLGYSEGKVWYTR